ncbi:hypothetical protein E2C01_033542 [Portunus trituberculatus]|uniref:Uncharacterized protein n=1 Tax=Portunus trituberculatus TaxID=210409 RepID=A0A5B7F369_PORTR|nr:hypothetical protein [Portunus trituberculatus]
MDLSTTEHIAQRGVGFDRDSLVQLSSFNEQLVHTTNSWEEGSSWGETHLPAGPAGSTKELHVVARVTQDKLKGKLMTGDINKGTQTRKENANLQVRKG